MSNDHHDDEHHEDHHHPEPVAEPQWFMDRQAKQKVGVAYLGSVLGMILAASLFLLGGLTFAKGSLWGGFTLCFLAICWGAAVNHSRDLTLADLDQDSGDSQH